MYTTISPNSVILITRFHQNAEFTSPCTEATTIASTSKASVSVIRVPPMAILTALFFVTPNLLMIGYAIKV